MYTSLLNIKVPQIVTNYLHQLHMCAKTVLFEVISQLYLCLPNKNYCIFIWLHSIWYTSPHVFQPINKCNTFSKVKHTGKIICSLYTYGLLHYTNKRIAKVFLLYSILPFLKLLLLVPPKYIVHTKIHLDQFLCKVSVVYWM